MQEVRHDRPCRVQPGFNDIGAGRATACSYWPATRLDGQPQSLAMRIDVPLCKRFARKERSVFNLASTTLSPPCDTVLVVASYAVAQAIVPDHQGHWLGAHQ